MFTNPTFIQRGRASSSAFDENSAESTHLVRLQLHDVLEHASGGPPWELVERRQGTCQAMRSPPIVIWWILCVVQYIRIRLHSEHHRDRGYGCVPPVVRVEL